MGISYAITVLPTHILVTGTGNYDLAEVERALDKVLAVASAHQQPKILIDVRKMTGNLSLAQRYEFGEMIAKLYSRQPPGSFCLIAVVGNEPLLDAEHFGETVAVNRGVPYTATMDMQEALDWLKIHSSPAQQTPK